MQRGTNFKVVVLILAAIAFLQYGTYSVAYNLGRESQRLETMYGPNPAHVWWEYESGSKGGYKIVRDVDNAEQEIISEIVQIRTEMSQSKSVRVEGVWSEPKIKITKIEPYRN